MVPSPTRALIWTGRAMVTAGLLMVAFAGFQVWGTGLAEARAQHELGRELALRLATSTTSPSPPYRRQPEAGPASRTATSVLHPTSQPGAPGTPVAGRTRRPAPGRAAGRITIPAINVDKVFVEGIDRDHLRMGPGRYPDNPWPGQAGNAAIAGHRTTHGAPFFDLDRLQPGDEIVVETFDGRFRYLVQGHDDGAGTTGHVIVDPSAVDVLEDKGDNRLTLTACHPKYSAAQRIVVTALLVDDPLRSEPPNRQPDGPDALAARTSAGSEDGVEFASTGGVITSVESANSVDASLGWQPRYLWPTGAGAALTAAVSAAAWWMGRRRNRWAVYAVATCPGLVAMFWWFTNLDKLLPAV